LEDGEESEWLIIKVPKEMQQEGELFLVDYVDGDTEDEFKWLEGPHCQAHTTVQDLLDRRRTRSREARRRQGHTEFRKDEDLDLKDPHGKRLVDPEPRGRSRSEEVKRESSSSVSPSTGRHPPRNSQTSNGGSSSMVREKGLKAIMKEALVEDNEEDDQEEHEEEEDEIPHTVLMTQIQQGNGATPLHDMSCVGIDTCSAKSISCVLEDFLDLQLSPGGKVSYELRGVGGISKSAGKGVMVLYSKDIDGKKKAVIEPRGIYLDSAPSQFRILGQQKMKKRGVTLIQDYDDAGGDILKCKRSGTVLPLLEEGGILLMKTFTYRPTDRMKEQLRNYVEKLVEGNNVLPHVIDLDEVD
jgi:hypothetical protein